MDLIIGPVYSNNLTKVAAYAKNMGIPVVSPVPLMNNSSLYGNPNLFLSNSALSVANAQKKLVSRFAEYPEGNFILIHSDTTGAGPDLLRFRSMISGELGTKISDGAIKFRELQFYGRSGAGADSVALLGRYLSDKAPNIIIISSEESPVISETMEVIHSYAKKFDIRVYGYPVMRDIENLDPKYYFDLDVTLYYPFWIDYSSAVVRAFLSDYRQKFLTEPIETSYAWHGYDLAWYFISGIAMHGNRFLENPGIHNPDLLENQFDFVRQGPGNGFENQMMFLLRYTKDYEVQLVPESDSQNVR
jgi:hypothetical protein